MAKDSGAGGEEAPTGQGGENLSTRRVITTMDRNTPRMFKSTWGLTVLKLAGYHWRMLENPFVILKTDKTRAKQSSIWPVLPRMTVSRKNQS